MVSNLYTWVHLPYSGFNVRLYSNTWEMHTDVQGTGIKYIHNTRTKLDSTGLKHSKGLPENPVAV